MIYFNHIMSSSSHTSGGNYKQPNFSHLHFNAFHHHYISSTTVLAPSPYDLNNMIENWKKSKQMDHIKQVAPFSMKFVSGSLFMKKRVQPSSLKRDKHVWPNWKKHRKNHPKAQLDHKEWIQVSFFTIKTQEAANRQTKKKTRISIKKWQ